MSPYKQAPDYNEENGRPQLTRDADQIHMRWPQIATSLFSSRRSLSSSICVRGLTTRREREATSGGQERCRRALHMLDCSSGGWDERGAIWENSWEGRSAQKMKGRPSDGRTPPPRELHSVTWLKGQFYRLAGWAKWDLFRNQATGQILKTTVIARTLCSKDVMKKLQFGDEQAAGIQLSATRFTRPIEMGKSLFRRIPVSARTMRRHHKAFKNISVVTDLDLK